MQQSLTPYPFVKMFVLLAIGILMGYYNSIGLITTMVIFLFLSVFCLLLQIIKFAPSKYTITIKSVFFALLYIVFGVFITNLNNSLNHRNYKANTVENATAYEVTVIEQPVEKPKTIKLLVAINNIINDTVIQTNYSKAYLYIAKDSLANSITLGSHLLINNSLQLLEGTGNPGAFNFVAYCAFKGIYHQAYIPEGKFIILPQKSNFKVEALLNKCRNFVITTIKKYITDTVNQGLCEALLIGYKNDLDKDLVKAYSNTGVVHVIAISGLHVGIIYEILAFLLLPLTKQKNWKPYTIILQILFIWFFAFLTGASPSVLRSAVMFSIIAAGHFSSRSPNMLNSLAASGFLLLCFQPFLLWDVGFQLSYLAVLSIIFFYNAIRKFLAHKNWYINKIGQMAAVTLSAQILTTPISIYIFHQFPNYFLLSNMLIVPISSLILIMLIVLLAVQFFNFLGLWVGKLTNLFVTIMNKLVYFFEQLPFALTQNININFLQLSILYIAIINFSIFYFYKKKVAFFIGLGLIFGCLLVQIFKQNTSYNKSQIVVLNVPKHNYIGLQNGGTIQVISDTNIGINSPLYNFYVRPTLINLGSPIVTNTDTLQTNIINFKNYVLLFLNKDKLQQLPLLDTTKITLLFATNNNKNILKLIPALPKNSMVVANQSNSNYYLKNVAEACSATNIKFYNTVVKGALLLE